MQKAHSATLTCQCCHPLGFAISGAKTVASLAAPTMHANSDAKALCAKQPVNLTLHSRGIRH